MVLWCIAQGLFPGGSDNGPNPYLQVTPLVRMQIGGIRSMRENRRNLLPTTKSPALHWSKFELRDDSKVWNGGQPRQVAKGRACVAFGVQQTKARSEAGLCLSLQRLGSKQRDCRCLVLLIRLVHRLRGRIGAGLH